jgi:hypothetical protein
MHRSVADSEALKGSCTRDCTEVRLILVRFPWYTNQSPHPELPTGPGAQRATTDVPESLVPKAVHAPGTQETTSTWYGVLAVGLGSPA